MSKAINEPIINSIKIGRKEYLIKKGDYMLFNGSCYQLCAYDGRTLKIVGWSMYSNLVIPKRILIKIPLDKMIKEEYVSHGMNLVRWFF